MLASQNRPKTYHGLKEIHTVLYVYRQGYEFNGCTTYDDDEYWCVTEVDPGWEYCNTTLLPCTVVGEEEHGVINYCSVCPL